MREPLQPSQIRALRESAGLDPIELAEQLGVPLENVLIWEATYDLVYLEPDLRDRLFALAQGAGRDPVRPDPSAGANPPST